MTAAEMLALCDDALGSDASHTAIVILACAIPWRPTSIVRLYGRRGPRGRIISRMPNGKLTVAFNAQALRSFLLRPRPRPAP